MGLSFPETPLPRCVLPDPQSDMHSFYDLHDASLADGDQLFLQIPPPSYEQHNTDPGFVFDSKRAPRPLPRPPPSVHRAATTTSVTSSVSSSTDSTSSGPMLQRRASGGDAPMRRKKLKLGPQLCVINRTEFDSPVSPPTSRAGGGAFLFPPLHASLDPPSPTSASSVGTQGLPSPSGSAQAPVPDDILAQNDIESEGSGTGRNRRRMALSLSSLPAHELAALRNAGEDQEESDCARSSLCSERGLSSALVDGEDGDNYTQTALLMPLSPEHATAVPPHSARLTMEDLGPDRWILERYSYILDAL